MKFLSTDSILLKRIIYALFILFFAFIALKIFPVSEHILTDAAYYLMGAESIAKGNGFYSYNVGYLEDASINDFKNLIPITRYQPLLSVTIAAVSKLLGINILLASRVVNILFYAVFLFTWLVLYQKLFSNTGYFAIASLFLLFTAQIYTYFLPPHSEMLFIALLGVLGNLIYFWHDAKSIKVQFFYTFLLAFISILIVLTRYAGIGFIVAFFIGFLLVFQASDFRQRIVHFFVYGVTFSIGFGFWAYRNMVAMGAITSKYPDNYHGTLFDFDRIVEILNYFLGFSLGFPSSIENYLFLLLIPILLIIGYLFYKKYYATNPVSLWLLISVTVYVSMIIYMGIGNRAVDKINGFMRFFALLQPFLVAILVLMLRSLFQLKENILAKLSIIFIVSILAISLLSGMNRTRIFIQTLHKAEENNGFYESIRQKATESDLILSNQWQNVSARTALPIVQIHYKQDIDNFVLKYKGKYNKIYIVLLKDVGVTYRQGVDTWQELLKDKQVTIIAENPETIFVEFKEK